MPKTWCITNFIDDTWISYLLLYNKLFLSTFLRTITIYYLSGFLQPAQGLMVWKTRLQGGHSHCWQVDAGCWWLVLSFSPLGLSAWMFLQQNTMAGFPQRKQSRDLGRSHMSFTTYPWKSHITCIDFQDSHNSVLSECETGPSKCLTTKRQGSLQASLGTCHNHPYNLLEYFQVQRLVNFKRWISVF